MKDIEELKKLKKAELLKIIEELQQEIIQLKNKNGGRPLKLKDEEKKSIIFYRLQGKTVKEIAEIFNCSMSTVNRILAREEVKRNGRDN